MFDWLNKRKTKQEDNYEDESQELSPRSRPPVSPEQAFKEWANKSPAPPISKSKYNRRK
jgi:hypothetical protein|tara:strand:+ start:1514 stop:1690 length:177 start_codon:yes stop_codon:yes gene_type:complete